MAPALTARHALTTVMRRASTSLLAALALFHAAQASALENRPVAWADEAPAASSRVWYGWQILLVDVSAFAGAALSIRTSGTLSTTLGVVGIGGYLAGGAIVHAAHRRSGALVGGSIALRVVLPLLGGFVGAAAGYSGECGSGSTNSGDGQSLSGLCGLAALGYAVLGAGIGALTASIIDVAALSWSTAPEVPRASPERAAWTLRPITGVVRAIDDRRTLTFGVVGDF